MKDHKLYIEPRQAEVTDLTAATKTPPTVKTDTIPPETSITTAQPSADGTAAEESTEAQEDEQGFVPYISGRLTGGIPHPAALVETAAMAAVVSPPITDPPMLDPGLITEGALSNVQLERICYAGQRHSQRLPSGARAAYLIGDGTGFGKGRCLPASSSITTTRDEPALSGSALATSCWNPPAAI